MYIHTSYVTLPVSFAPRVLAVQHCCSTPGKQESLNYYQTVCRSMHVIVARVHTIGWLEQEHVTTQKLKLGAIFCQ